MRYLSTAGHGCPIGKLRFHPSERLLASIASARAEVRVWDWDEAGTLGCRALIGREGAARVRDVAWAPHGDVLALVGGGRAIELWAEGRLLKTLGKHPTPGRTREFRFGIRTAGSAKIDMHTRTEQVHLAEQGYGAVAFSADGTRLVASRFGDDPQGEDPTEVDDVASGELVGTLWRSDTTLAMHPEGEILATLSSDQGASAVRFGRLTDCFQGYDAQLNVIADGYRRLVFGPRGDMFALIGHSYGVGIRIYEFPSCRAVFELDFEEWDDVWDLLSRGLGGEPSHPEIPDGSDTGEFVRDLRTVNDRLAFHPDGRTLLVGTMKGHVIRMCPGETSKPVGAYTVHDGPVLAIDVSTAHAMLATARFDGEIKLWRLEDTAATLASAGKPMSEAFLGMFETINPMASEDQFRMTDGKRWYDSETIDDDELDEDAPPWAQIAKWMRRGHLPGQDPITLS